MARHDYDLPPDYEQRIEEGTMSEWYTEERCRRRVQHQDMRSQDEPGLLRRAARRLKRRVKARSETVSLEEMR